MQKSPLLVIAAVCYGLFFILSFSRVGSSGFRGVIWADSEGYYKYLPAVFILKDVHKMDAGSVWPYYNDKGEFVNKYTCGVAYFQLPFFLLGYLTNYLNGYENDIYNDTYAKSIAMAGITVTFIGLLLVFLSLKREFGETIAWWAGASIFFGTNLFHYATKEMGGSHVYTFCLFAMLVYFFPYYLKKPSLKNSLLLGVIIGWALLIRPTNGIAFLWMLGYNVYTWQQLKERFQFFVQHWKTLLYMALAAFLMIFPQLLYWKEMTGNWIYYSYSSETFAFWKEPKIAAVLFDTQNGLFLYSPLVLLMVAGIIIGISKSRYSGPVLLLIFALATYAFASWWAWWFGGSFGHRCYVEYYALLVIPLAGLYQQVSESRFTILRYGFVSLTVLMMIFATRLSFLYVTLGGPWDGADWRWNVEKYAWVMRHFF